ncbi:ceramide synthase isoform X1 [Syngnathoides biaculeatus]|uniref:ceramide synthase isoform X1 n=2 Tax=Syngnathoides biaculeatus TaxID=300417 RepID=UPI002ADDE9C0|nr:ceramide synthase isoform X1 [Syngnathoides biaculeatus]XP_061659571.1 ceramide synthase isoform X1 [Syngnathoides biaculeatus]
MFQVLACGAVVFPGLFFAFRKILPRVFKHWSDADVVLVSERLVSSIHAVMATTAGVVVVSSCRGNVINDRHWLATHFVIWFGVPYMTYDLLAMYLSHYHRFRVKGHEEYKHHSFGTVNAFVRREFLLVLHHIALLTVLLPVTLFFRKDQGDFFIGCLFLTELSTPFVSLGKILIQLGLQEGWLHKYNGGMVLLTFFACRIALFPYMYWAYGHHYGIPLYAVPFNLSLTANLGNSCILAPQVYWFVLLCRKGYRLYQRSRCPPSPPVKDQ